VVTKAPTSDAILLAQESSSAPVASTGGAVASTAYTDDKTAGVPSLLRTVPERVNVAGNAMSNV
jgi:hypothetical protein